MNLQGAEQECRRSSHGIVGALDDSSGAEVGVAIGGGVDGDEVLKPKERTARSEAQGWRRASVRLLVAWCHGGESTTTALRRRLSTGKDKAHTRAPHRSYS
ncbi:hypothetical protein ACFX19_020466 [Malus domestica]